MDYTSKRQPITREKLAGDVARSVKRFLEVRQQPTESKPLALGSDIFHAEREGGWSRRRLKLPLAGHRVVEQHVPHPLGPGLYWFVAARIFHTVIDSNDAGGVAHLNSENGNVDPPVHDLAMRLNFEIYPFCVRRPLGCYPRSGLRLRHSNLVVRAVTNDNFFRFSKP